MFGISGQIVDVKARKIFAGTIVVSNGMIEDIREEESKDSRQLPFIIPGFIDAHVHIESSMLIPSEFARLAVVHGTIATVSDPHEIANVCGIEGVRFMIDNGKKVPFKFHFGAPSCVPATTFETAGARLGPEEVEELLLNPDIYYLSEMMNFPGVLNKDREVLEKINTAHRLGKPVDGHAPGLRGELAKKYIAAGISTDHECFTKEEALDKLAAGMKVIIREGSAAKNFEALIELVQLYPDQIMFCSDDKHPDSLVEGHINLLCARAIDRAIDIFSVLQVACINPVNHYKMKTGLLQKGDPADFIVVKDLRKFEVLKTYIGGVLVAENGTSKIASVPATPINNFSCTEKTADDFSYSIPENLTGKLIPVIEALDGQLITNNFFPYQSENNQITQANVEKDILKLVVVNRYADKPVAIAFIKNFGLKTAAIASSVAHDSHNIIAVGSSDENICRAINLVIREKGGVSFCNNNLSKVLPLPVAGLMSNLDGYEIAKQYTTLDQLAKTDGSDLQSPYMTLSFMALLVIPHIKLSDLGLFNGDEFKLITSV